VLVAGKGRRKAEKERGEKRNTKRRKKGKISRWEKGLSRLVPCRSDASGSSSESWGKGEGKRGLRKGKIR